MIKMREHIMSGGARMKSLIKQTKVSKILPQCSRLIQIISMRHMPEAHVKTKEVILPKLLMITIWLWLSIKRGQCLPSSIVDSLEPLNQTYPISSIKLMVEEAPTDQRLITITTPTLNLRALELWKTNPPFLKSKPRALT